MTTEQNQPQAQPPQGQPQGHRRRRRRRKGAKGQPNSPQSSGQASQQPQGQNLKQGGSKRFFQKNGSGNGQGGGRRRNKQRKQQVFVGPMDHSYRAANGNLADAPPATIEYRNGNVHPNGFHPTEAAPEPPPVVARENAPTRIFCFIEDLFFLAKIQETARKLGVKVGFVKAEKDIVAKLANVPEDERPSLIVFDLNNANAKPLTLIPKIKAKMKRGTSVIGFLSHLQGDLKVKALEAGCDMVMPRSAFSQNLPSLLRRHGLEEVETIET